MPGRCVPPAGEPQPGCVQIDGTGPEDVVLSGLGLTRMAPDGSLVVNSSRGGGAKDTWVVRDPDAVPDPVTRLAAGPAGGTRTGTEES